MQTNWLQVANYDTAIDTNQWQALAAVDGLLVKVSSRQSGVMGLISEEC